MQRHVFTSGKTRLIRWQSEFRSYIGHNERRQSDYGYDRSIKSDCIDGFANWLTMEGWIMCPSGRA